MLICTLISSEYSVFSAFGLGGVHRGVTMPVATLRQGWVEGCNEPPAVPTPSGGSFYSKAEYTCITT
jgi:hypothetical protein